MVWAPSAAPDILPAPATGSRRDAGAPPRWQGRAGTGTGDVSGSCAAGPPPCLTAGQATRPPAPGKAAGEGARIQKRRENAMDQTSASSELLSCDWYRV